MDKNLVNKITDLMNKNHFLDNQIIAEKILELPELKAIQAQARVSPKVVTTIEMPSHINIFNASTDRCDMLQGHCACGAYHKLSDWKIERIQ